MSPLGTAPVASISQHRCAFAFLLVGLGVLPVHAATDIAKLQSQYQQLRTQFAAAHRDLLPQLPPTGSLVFVAPDQYSPVVGESGKEVDALQKYADALYGLAKQAAKAGQMSLAFQWVTEVVRENPNHAEGRRVLGYEQRDGRWLTAYGVKMFDAGKVWDAKRGWVAGKDAKNGTDGSNEDPQADAARHADIKNGWQVRTDHFLVTTNHSLSAGAELAARLERLYQVWRQLFAGFYYSEKEVRGLFAGERIARIQARPFRVYYYRSRENYIEALRRRQPRIAETLGIYFDNTREAHFFADELANAAAGGAAAGTSDVSSSSSVDLTKGDPPVATNGESGQPAPTLYHEAVHQLFQESKPSAKRIGAMANYWVVEGAANYFETLSEHVDPQAGLFYTIGEAAAGRLPSARQRLRDGFYIPIGELVKLNQDELQRHPEIRKLYSESTGLAAFLVDGENGRYREPLVRYLQAVYTGRDNAGTLAEVTETSTAELDAQYRRFMESLP
jgi:hypothetical protein